jgi:hypothetical protein
MVDSSILTTYERFVAFRWIVNHMSSTERVTVEHRHVKGSLFIDYVRMLRGLKAIDWSKHLLPEDLSYLVQRVDPSGWYPMATFERMGLAILVEIAHGDLAMVEAWGRVSIDGLARAEPNLIAPGDPRETLMRFGVLRASFFDYPALTLREVNDEDASVDVHYGMGSRAEEAATRQTMGFFDRLLAMAGARDVVVELTQKSWELDPTTTIAMRWK